MIMIKLIGSERNFFVLVEVKDLSELKLRTVIICFIHFPWELNSLVRILTGV